MTLEASKNTYSVDLTSYSVEQFRNDLRNDVIRVKFTKVDGSERVMHATLLQDVIVPYERKTNREKQRPENMIPVWDADISAWRTIDFNKITEVSL